MANGRSGVRPVAKATRTAAAKAASGRGPGPEPAASGIDQIAGIGSDAVKKATGRTWAQWLEVLDAAGAKGMEHKAIAIYLSEKHGVPDWWCQMVTVGYEQARGLREKGQTAEGYRVSASRTVNAPLPRLYAAWADEKRRARWLPDAPIEVRKATKDKSMRITWEPGPKATNLDVNFYPKGEGKSQVSVEHSRLKTAAAGEKLKKFWTDRLGALKELVEREV